MLEGLETITLYRVLILRFKAQLRSRLLAVKFKLAMLLAN